MLSYIEVSKSNLLHNYQLFRNYVIKSTKIILVVKGNAYGHGIKEIITILNEKSEYFALDDIEDLRIARTITDKPILVLGYIENDEILEAIKLNANLIIHNLQRLEIMNSIAKKINKIIDVYIEYDSFLGRQGVNKEELIELLDKSKLMNNINILGIYSHFSNIEDTSDFSYAQKQIDSFEEANKLLKDKGLNNTKKHISSTSGILAYKNTTNEYVRLGIGLYGMWPSKELEEKSDITGQLKPVLRWVTHIAQIRILPKNYFIGYGLTFKTNKITKIAIIPQGYYDGYDRGLSNIGEVLIHGRRCKILGRISMNMMVADVSEINDAKSEDEVVLLGNQRNEFISAEEIAEKLDTINYEITTRINPLLPRIIVK